MLELIVKGLVLWFYDLILECVGFIGNLLLEVFSMDTSYFVSHAPVVLDMQKILIAVGWALLLGNLAFQAMRSMMAGIGLNAEDPKLLFAKSFLFAFLLFASPEICQVGMNLTSKIIVLLQMPDTVNIMAPEEAWFDFTAGWLLAVICGLIMLFQVFKLFFEIGERYVVLNVLVFFAPVAFAMGGSRSTEDIFKGWVRMFGSMCVVMVSNVFFLKVILSALSTIPNTLTIIPWLIFVVGLCKVARRIDDILCRLGLNAAHTGRERMFPGAVTAMFLRSAANTVRQAAQAYTGQMPHFGGFRGYAPGGWRWGGTFSDLPELPPPALPAANRYPGLPGPSAPNGPSPEPPSGSAGPAGGQKSDDTSGNSMHGSAAHYSSRRATRPQVAGTQAGAAHTKRSFPAAHGNIDIFMDDDDAPMQKKQQRPPAVLTPNKRRAAGSDNPGLETASQEKPSGRKSRPASRPPQGQVEKASSGGRVTQQDVPKATRPPLHRAGEAEYSSGQTAYMEKKNSTVASSANRSEPHTAAEDHAVRPLETPRAESVPFSENTTRRAQKRPNSTYEQGMEAALAAQRPAETTNHPMPHSAEKQGKKAVHTARQQTMPKNGLEETQPLRPKRRPPNGRKR